MGCVWAVIFSWLQKETDEEYPALCPHHSNKGYSNNLRHCSLFFNLLMSSVLLHPCQSKCLELISKPGARLITKSSRSREMSDTHTAALQVSPAKHLSTQNQTSSIQQTQNITSSGCDKSFVTQGHCDQGISSDPTNSINLTPGCLPPPLEPCKTQ